MKFSFKKYLRPYTGSIFYSNKSYAQEGEDIVIDRLLEQKRNGFYIEIGCHHPFRFSNTYFFYKKNWHGICVDPLPGTQELFKKWRPKDIAIEMGVSKTPSILTYYMFNEPALNTFNETLAKERDGLRSYKIIDSKEIQTATLAAILSQQNIPETIDLMSVDVEGLDLEVLESNDWEKFRPNIVIAECLASDLNSLATNEIGMYLSTKNYLPYAKTGNSIIFTAKNIFNNKALMTTR